MGKSSGSDGFLNLPLVIRAVTVGGDQGGGNSRQSSKTMKAYTRALPDIKSGPEVWQILKVWAVQKPDVFFTRQKISIRNQPIVIQRVLA